MLNITQQNRDAIVGYLSNLTVTASAGRDIMQIVELLKQLPEVSEEKPEKESKEKKEK